MNSIIYLFLVLKYKTAEDYNNFKIIHKKFHSYSHYEMITILQFVIHALNPHLYVIDMNYLSKR